MKAYPFIYMSVILIVTRLIEYTMKRQEQSNAEYVYI